MTEGNVANWLKTRIDAAGGIAPGSAGEQAQSIGVYAYRDEKDTQSQRICIGGIGNTTYQEEDFVIQIRWTEDTDASGQKAREVYDLLYGLSGIEMDGVHIISADPGRQVQWIGRDANNVCEYQIRATLRYERTRS